MWIIPVAAGLAERVIRHIVQVLEPHMGWVSFGLGIDGVMALSAAINDPTTASLVTKNAIPDNKTGRR